MFEHDSYHHPKLELRRISPTERGVFATRSIETGEILTISSGIVIPYHRLKRLPAALRCLCFFIENDFYMRPVSAAKIALGYYMNHSCEPNAGGDADYAVTLVALRRIDAGEEVTCDYQAQFIPRNKRHPPLRRFRCRCGAASCRGIIRF